MGPYGAPEAVYSAGPVVKGFLEGYQTMDTIAALNFGIIIAINIRAKGVEQEGAVVRETVKAGVIAGILLALIYGPWPISGHLRARLRRIQRTAQGYLPMWQAACLEKQE